MMDTSTLRLKAVSGTPLENHLVRSTVIAAARGLAERSDVVITNLSTTDSEIVIELNIEEVGALGFAAELRRLTNTWYEQKYRDGPLWGTPAPGK